MEILPGTDIRIINRNLKKSVVKQALFDFDGTISLLREGWEKIMAPMMVECICGDHESTQEIVDDVKKTIDETTGLQTILQMQGLVKRVQDFGLVPEADILDAWGYKRMYNGRLMELVKGRIAQLETGAKTVEDFTLKGALDFCGKLFARGIDMVLASGTDQEDVRVEAGIIGVAHYFKGGVYGAVGTVEAYSKDKIIREIFRNDHLQGSELIVFGDGPVEIRSAKSSGAIAVGVASDEVAGFGWDEKKTDRLIRAGCDILIPDFSDGDIVLEYLFGCVIPKSNNNPMKSFLLK